MSGDDRSDLREMVGQVRAMVERERQQGRRYFTDPAMTEWVKSPAVAAPPPVATAPRAPAPATRAPAEATPPAAPPAAAPRAAASAPAPARPAGAKALPAVGLPAGDPRDLEAMTRGLAELEAAAAACRKCGLCETRTRPVYGTGTARQPLLFVGEAPGYNEDQQGIPFVGQAGKLLTDIIGAMGFDRKDVYIANVLKCRPPENRDPLPQEVEACRPWLERQIELIRPRVICTLGRHSAQLLTGRPKASIGTLRGRVASYQGIPVVPTYHPAFLLRSPSHKRITWEDVQLVRDLYLAADGGESTPGVTA